MTLNDIFRRLRFILDYSDNQMIAAFKEADETVTREQISNWLKKDDVEEYEDITPIQLAIFLNGLINVKRGKREGAAPVIEKELTNNAIFMKLKIAFSHQAEDILKLMESVDFIMSKHELSAFFRKPEHKHYRVCQEQILRKYLNALQLKYRKNLDDQDSATSEE